MTNTSNNHSSFLRNPHFISLKHHYINHPIALYTGAGVSWAKDKNYGLRGWDNFVKRILKDHEGLNSTILEEFELRSSQEWKDEPWEMAEWVAERIGKGAFERHIMEIVQKQENFQKKYKLLSGKYLKSASTLRSVAAFCAKFRSGKLVIYDKGAVAIYQPVPNPRLRAVLTSNYDPFLEAASSTMYRNPILKPVGARGSSVGNLSQIPVFHIHGYVNFPRKFVKEKKSEIEPLVDPVITKSDYESAWKSDDVFNFTMGPQIHVLRHNAVLFVGFSFRDRWVNNLLEDLNKERKCRKDRLFHYALMKKEDVESKGERFFKNLGVKPISLKKFKEIPNLLSVLYQQALIHDYGHVDIELPLYESQRGKKTGERISLSPDQYFNELCACRICSVWKGRR